MSTPSSSLFGAPSPTAKGMNGTNASSTSSSLSSSPLGTPVRVGQLPRVFNHKLAAHTRIRGAIGNELDESIGVTNIKQKPERTRLRRILNEEKDEDTPRGANNAKRPLRRQQAHSSDSSSSDEDHHHSSAIRSTPMKPAHNYAALGINPDLPLSHPLNQQNGIANSNHHLHSSNAQSPPAAPFHPIASPPAPNGTVSSFQFKPLSAQPAASSTRHALLHPGLLGLRGPQPWEAGSPMRPANERNRLLGSVNASGTGTLSAGAFSSSPFISPGLQARLAFQMANRPPPSASATASSPATATPTPATPASEDDAVAKLLSRNANKARPRSPPTRVTGVHELQILAHEFDIHSVSDAHRSHDMDNVPELLVPVVRAGWQDLASMASTSEPDADGNLRGPNGELIPVANLPSEAALLMDHELDPAMRQFLLSYVQSHTAKHTDHERNVRQMTVEQRAAEIELQKAEAARRVQELNKRTEEDERREREHELALLENANSSTAHFNLSELPELPELPPSFYDLESTFHLSPSASKNDLRASAPGSLVALPESSELESQLDNDEFYYLRRNPRRWRRRSFSRGHNLVLLPGFKEQVNPEDDDNYIDEWKPVEVVDQNLPDSGLGGGLAAVLADVNTNVRASAPLSIMAPTAASKPLAAMTDDQVDEFHDAHMNAAATIMAEHADAAAMAEFAATTDDTDMNAGAVFEFGDDDEEEEKKSSLGDDTTDTSGLDSQGRPKLSSETLTQDEKEARLEEFLAAREREERNSTIGSTGPLDAARQAILDSAAAAERAKAEEDKRALQSFTSDVVLPNLEDAIHRQRLINDPIYRREWDREQIRIAYKKQCDELQKAFDKSERDRLRAIYQAEQSIQGARDEDTRLTQLEDEQLSKAKNAFESLVIQQRTLAKSFSPEERNKKFAEFDATVQAEEAQWDAKLNALEDAAKKQHASAQAQRARYTEGRTAERESLMALGRPVPPEDPNDIELLAVQSAENHAERLLTQYEEVFDAKEDWREQMEAKRAALSSNEEKDKQKLDGMDEQIKDAKLAYTALLNRIESAREKRDIAIEAMEQKISKNNAADAPRLILPPPPTFDDEGEDSYQPKQPSLPEVPREPVQKPVPKSDVAAGAAAAPSSLPTPPSTGFSAFTSPDPRPTSAFSSPGLAPGVAKVTIATPKVVDLSATTQPTVASSNVSSSKPLVIQTATATPIVPVDDFVPPSDPNLVIRQLMSGGDFVLHTFITTSGVQSINSKPIYLWAEFPKYDFQTRALDSLITTASFFCCDAAKSRPTANNTMPLDASGRLRVKEQKLPWSIIDVLLPGKSTPVLASSFCSKVDERRCFAFGGSKAMVSLEAESEAKAREWVEGIKFLLQQAKAATSNTVPPKPAPAVPAAAAAAATPAPVAAAAVIESAPISMDPEPDAVRTVPTQYGIASPAPTPVAAASSSSSSSSVPPKKAPTVPAVAPTFISPLPPLLEISQRFKSPKPLTDSLSLLAYGTVFRMYGSAINALSNTIGLSSITDYLFYVDFSARSDSRMSSSRGGAGSIAGSVAATPKTKNAISPVMQASLYYSPPGKRQKVANQVIYLADIIRVTEGKGGPSSTLFAQANSSLSNSQSRIIPASHCFTLTVATSTSIPPTTMLLTIQTPSLSIRSLFLKGLYEIFERQYEKMKADALFEQEHGSGPGIMPERVIIDAQTEPDDDYLIQQPIQPMSPRARSPEPAAAAAEEKYPNAASPRAQSPVGAPNAELLALLLDVLSRGEEFTQHCISQYGMDEPPSKRRIFLWVDFPDMTPAANDDEDDIIHSPQGGVLYWCDAVVARGGPNGTEDDKGMHRYHESGHSFPIGTVHSIVSGKKSEVFNHPTNNSLADATCFSFATSHPNSNDRQLDLQCDQDSIQQLWVGGLKHVLQALA